ncbi:MAG: succinate--CoA ligase subunit beta [Rectinema subterraneum]|uniref:succinate--CoA ligase subunit beta n=1 Tax=Rectinema subterraneum TaxID=2653714 RepID=UPI003C7E3ECF
MKLHEYQAKALFREFGIPTPQGELADTVEAAVNSGEHIGWPVAFKAQVLRGGRGKAGLVKIVQTPEEARTAAQAFFASDWKVRKILVEPAIAHEHELYVSFSADSRTGMHLLLASAEGGVEIEDLARTAPEKILKERIDCIRGILPYQARSAAYDLGLAPSLAKGFASIIEKLYRLYVQKDCELAEINPLFVTPEGNFIAADAKISIDDNALFRHPEFEQDPADFDSDIAREAAVEGIPYLQFDGDISLMCAGAGLTTAVYDLVADFGGTVANYLEFGGPNYRKSVRAMELCIKNNPKVILIVTFGTIARADIMAEGIVEAIRRLKPNCPIVTCIRGTGEDKAREILLSAGLEPLTDTEEAVKKAVELAHIAYSTATERPTPAAASKQGGQP